jgi:hypothetical protein
MISKQLWILSFRVLFFVVSLPGLMKTIYFMRVIDEGAVLGGILNP